MKIENKLLLYIFLILVIGLIVGVIGGGYLINYYSKITKQGSVEFLKKREIIRQKEHIKSLVNFIIRDISLLNSETEIIKNIKLLYPKNQNNYIFIYKLYNFNGGKNFAKMLLNENRKDLENKFISDNYTDINGFAFRKEMLKLLRREGEGYVEYYYKKPNTSKIVKKITYFKYYRPYHLIVASGVYLDDIDSIVKDYKLTLQQFNSDILQKFMIVSLLIFLIIAFFAILIARIILLEFKKFRKAIYLNEKKLKYKLYLDELTNLKSRKSLVDDIEKQKFNYLILIDIDNFKNINQFFGARIGDIYLQEFAKILKQFRKTIPKYMILYRLGADEFVIGIKIGSKQDLESIISKLYNYIKQQTIIIENEYFDIDITIAYSDFPNPLRKVISTLVEAKAKRLSILSYEDIGDKEKEKEFFEMRKMLKTAIEKNQITPYAQPIVNSEKEVIKYELLMRIVTEDKVIPPYFLEYSKKIKLYTTISSIMIDKCFEFINKTDVLCSINIDMQDIMNKDIVNKLKQYTQNLKKPVVFEILESESFQNYSDLKEFIKEFRKYGVLFAIDDFGSGYSNYSEILELKPDYLKLDGSLIKNIMNSKENLVVVESILFVTKILNIKTTAEFVEDIRIYKRLRSLGIDEFQGYYFSKPIPLDKTKKAD